MVLSLVLVLQNFGSSNAPEAYRDSNSKADTEPEVSAPDLVQHQQVATRLEALELENEDLRDQIASQQQEIGALSGALNEASQQVTQAAAAAPSSPSEPDGDGDAVSEQLSEMQLERRYGPFLAGLELDPARELAIREALMRVLGYASSDFDMSSVEFASLLRDEMSRVISPSELARFDEYQEALPEQMLRQTFAGQVNAMTPGLSEATRAALVDVLVEEALIASLIQAPDGASAAYPLEQRMNVYANTATRFEGVLDSRENAALNRFLELQYAQLRSTLEEVQRAEAAGAIAQVDIRDGAIGVQIEQNN